MELPMLAATTPHGATGATARSDAALPSSGAALPHAIDREAIVRAVVATVPRARARAALRSVRSYLRVALGVTEAQALARSCPGKPDREALYGAARSALEGAADALASEPEGDLAAVLVVALLGESPFGHAGLFGVFAADTERRNALRALRIVGRVSRDLRAGGGVS